MKTDLEEAGEDEEAVKKLNAEFKAASFQVPPDDLFASQRSILAQRLRGSVTNIGQVTNFYQRLYNSVIDIDGTKSKWYVYDRALNFVEANIVAR